MYNPNDQNGGYGQGLTPLDLSGYGPTSMGGAPTQADIRRVANARYYSSRAAESMQFIDPYIQEAGGSALRLVGQANRQASAEELRRMLYSSGKGQMTLDAAMVARRSGHLGYGDPVNYANNIVQGVAAGGFGVNMLDPNGRMNGIGQRVSGNGLLSEHVSMGLTKSLMSDIYGNGTPDPEKNYGVDMEGASQIARKVMSRGGLGTSLSIEHNASLARRLSVSRDQQADTTLKSGMDRITGSQSYMRKMQDLEDMKEGTPEEQAAKVKAIKEFTKTLNNPKLGEELKGVLQTHDAIVINPESNKKLAAVIKEISKGMASLKDVYGELSDPELHQMLESVSGMKLNGDVKQTKHANMMVENLRNAAVIAGVDPKSYINMTQAMQSDMTQQLNATMGWDARSSVATKGLSAAFINESGSVAGARARSQVNAEVTAREAGLGGREGTAKDVTELMADKQQRQLEYMQKYGAVVAARGKLDTMDPARRASTQKLLDKFKSYNGGTQEDWQKRDEVTGKLKHLIGGTDYDSWAKSSEGIASMTLGQRGANMDELNKDVANFSLMDVRKNGLLESVKGELGTSDEETRALSTTILKDISGKGLEKMLSVSQQGKTKEERMAALHTETTKAGLSGGAADSLIGKFFDAEGNVRDKGKLDRIAHTATNVNPYGGSGWEDEDEAELNLSQAKSQGVRKILSPDYGKLDAQSIIKAVATKKVDGRSIDTMAEYMGAMKEAHLPVMVKNYDKDGNLITDENGKAKMTDLSDQFETKIDMLNLDKEGLGRLVKGSGDKNLVSKLGFKDDESLLSYTKGNTKHSMEVWKKLREQKGIEVGGGIDATNIMSTKAAEAAKGLDLDERASKAALVESMFPQLKTNERNGLLERVDAGEDPHLANFFSVDANKEERLTKSVAGVNKTRFASSGRMLDLTHSINATDAAGMKVMADWDKDGTVLKSMKAELSAFKSAASKGSEFAVGEDGKEHPLKASIGALSAAIEKMEAAAAKRDGVTQEMKVNNIIVTGDIKPAK